MSEDCTHFQQQQLDRIVEGIAALIETAGVATCKHCYEQLLYGLVKKLAKRYEQVVIELATEEST